jgi:hypothetical protein
MAAANDGGRVFVHNHVRLGMAVRSACFAAAVTWKQPIRWRSVSVVRLLSVCRRTLVRYGAVVEVEGFELGEAAHCPLAARSLHPLSTPQAIPPSVYDKPIAS